MNPSHTPPQVSHWYSTGLWSYLHSNHSVTLLVHCMKATPFARFLLSYLICYRLKLEIKLKQVTKTKTRDFFWCEMGLLSRLNELSSWLTNKEVYKLVFRCVFNLPHDWSGREPEQVLAAKCNRGGSKCSLDGQTRSNCCYVSLWFSSNWSRVGQMACLRRRLPIRQTFQSRQR